MKLRVIVDVPVVMEQYCPGDCQFINVADGYFYCTLFNAMLAQSAITLEAYRCEECKQAEVKDED